jgi:hypothetical protein
MNRLHFSRQTWTHLREHIPYLFAFIVTIYGLLCTVYSDVIVQNDNDFIFLPFRSLFAEEVEITLEELTGSKTNSEDGNNTYIFVLDISGSVANIPLSKDLHEKYLETIKYCNDLAQYQIEPNTDPTFMHFATVRLYKLLIDLYLQQPADGPTDDFAIWFLGDKENVLPIDLKKKVDRESVDEAIKAIDNITNEKMKNPDRSTDFSILFKRLLTRYEYELQVGPSDEYDNPSFIITIFSDFVPNEADAKWEQLADNIRRISNSRIMVNMIMLYEDFYTQIGDRNMQGTIFPYFKENIDWFRLNTVPFGKEKSDEFLYPTRALEKSIEFHYTNPRNISSSFIIRPSEKSYTIKMDIPIEGQSLAASKIRIHAQPLDILGKPIQEEITLVSGAGSYKTTLERGQKIKLVYTGGLPSDLVTSMLRLSIKEARKTYIIPIDFVKRLPDWAAWLMCTLQILGGVLFVVWPLRFLSKT